MGSNMPTRLQLPSLNFEYNSANISQSEMTTLHTSRVHGYNIHTKAITITITIMLCAIPTISYNIGGICIIVNNSFLAKQ